MSLKDVISADHRHVFNRPAFIKQVVDHNVETFHGEPRTYAGPENPPFIYGMICACGKFNAQDLCEETEARERAKRYKELQQAKVSADV